MNEMSKTTVLICDDTPAVQDSLSDYLCNDGYEVITVADGESALREISSRVPIIMLSARGSEVDRIVGLELGADNYVTKPFSPREISIRARRILERSDMTPASAPQALTFSDLVVYPDKNQAVVQNEIIDLTLKETRVLAFIVECAGKTATREQILNEVWGYEYFGDTRVVDTLIKRLRRKIMKEGVHFSIQAVYGSGYRIEETG